MTENEIRILGFAIQRDDSDKSNPYHYYTYDITKGLSFISNSNNDTKDGDWYIEFFNTDIAIRFYKMEQIQSLINTLEKAKLQASA